MKDLAELAGIIGQYPAYIRVLAGVWVLLTAGLVVLLIIFYPSTPLFALDFLRAAHTDKGQLAIEFGVRNRLGQTAQVTGAQLEFYPGAEKPKGGLQGVTQVSAKYSVFQQTDGTWASVDPSKLTNAATLQLPYDGQTYAVLNVRLAQTVKNGETDRFIVVLAANNLPDPGHETVEGHIVYNGTERTKSLTDSLNR